MGRKKVVMLLTNPFKPDPRVYKEAKTLTELGFDVTIVAWDREGVYPTDEMVDGIHIHRIRLKSKYASFLDFLIKLPLFYFRTFKYVVKNYKAITYALHANDFDTAPLALFISRLLGVKFVYDIHDLYHSRMSLLRDKKTSTLFQRVLLLLEILHARHADFVITVTRSVGGIHWGVKEFLVAHGVNPDSIKVVWNTPVLELFPKVQRKPHYGLVVGYVGSIRSLSSFVPLFEVARADKRLRILFVGSGSSIDNVRNLLLSEYPEVRAEFIGEVPYSEVFKYYSLCDVVYSVYPLTDNVRRALAVKMFESVVMGIPVIVNKDTLMEDFVRIYRCGVSTDYSPQDLRDALEKVIKIKPPKSLREKWNWGRNRRILKSVYIDIESKKVEDGGLSHESRSEFADNHKLVSKQR